MLSAIKTKEKAHTEETKPQNIYQMKTFDCKLPLRWVAFVANNFKYFHEVLQISVSIENKKKKLF